MAVPGFLSAAGANVAQWGQNVNQAVGGGGNLGKISTAIRDPNVNYTGSLNPFTAVSQLGGTSSFAPAQPSTGGLTAADDQAARDAAARAGASNQNSGTFTQDPQAAALAAARQQYGDPAQYDSQIQGYQGQLGGLDTQQNIGLQNLADQYQQGQNNLNDSNALNQRNYNQGVQQNTQSSYLALRLTAYEFISAMMQVRQ